MAIARSRMRMAAVSMVLLACNETTGAKMPPLPTALRSSVTNPYFPLPIGRTQVFQTQTAAGLEVDSLSVLILPKTVNGFAATEVLDRVHVAGSMTENTFDWFAQDPDGNVWYLGEDTKQYDNGVVIGTEGTWQWGVGGAFPGIIMWGDTTGVMNSVYRQEFSFGVAQDVGKVVALNESVKVAFGSFGRCIKTEEWGMFEKGPHETKFYCPDVGTVLAISGSGDSTQLVDVSP